MTSRVWSEISYVLFPILLSYMGDDRRYGAGATRVFTAALRPLFHSQKWIC